MKPAPAYHGFPNDARESAVYRDARADAKWCSPDALMAYRDVFLDNASDPDLDETARFMAQERFRAFDEELTRLDRVDRHTSDTAIRFDDQHQAWLDLADTDKARVSVPDGLKLAGVDVTRTGRSRGRDEFHSPCPICRDGVDHLVSWDGPDDRLWCRRCGWSTDVIGAASLIADDQFRDCVRWLAEYAALVVNDGR